jgi:hypothetical protein
MMLGVSSSNSRSIFMSNLRFRFRVHFCSLPGTCEGAEQATPCSFSIIHVHSAGFGVERGLKGTSNVFIGVHCRKGRRRRATSVFVVTGGDGVGGGGGGGGGVIGCSNSWTYFFGGQQKVEASAIFF